MVNFFMETFVFMKYFCNDNISNIPRSWMKKNLVYNQISLFLFYRYQKTSSAVKTASEKTNETVRNVASSVSKKIGDLR